MIPHSRPTLGETEANAAREVVLSGFIGQGVHTRRFERALAEYSRRRFAIAVSSGTAALHLALLAAQVHTNDEVLIPAFVCRAVLNAVLAVGATPVLVDIDAQDLTISSRCARNAITTKTKAIILPHMFGAPAALDEFTALGIIVIEDAASSIGATFHGQPVGSFGEISVFSFASTKMITSGHGGMLLTNNEQIAQAAKDFLDYDGTYREQRGALNYSFGDVPAAIGLVQLQQLEKFLQQRRAIADIYSRTLVDLDVRLPGARAGAFHSNYRYILQVQNDSDVITNALRRQNIDARAQVAHFLYDYLALPANLFPVTESIRHTLVSLPIYPSLTDEQVHYIAEVTKNTLLQFSSQINTHARAN